jgi:hypothetical protein
MKPQPKVVLFIFGPRGHTSQPCHGQGQRPFHTKRQRPFLEFLAAAVGSDTETRIRVDVAALPILVIEDLLGTISIFVPKNGGQVPTVIGTIKQNRWEHATLRFENGFEASSG